MKMTDGRVEPQRSTADTKPPAPSKPRLLVMGLTGLALHTCAPGDVLISIGDPGSPIPAAAAEFDDVVRVEFADDQFDGWEGRGRNLTCEDAERIVKFVARHMDAPRIVIHCAAGASRSVSVAEALATVFRIPHERAVILNYGAYWCVALAHQAVNF